MARIIVSYYKMQEISAGARMYYYESVIEELKRQGNDVLVLNSAFFCTYESNIIRNNTVNSMVLKKALDFKADLIITFNHRIPKCILDNIDVPTVIWDGDSPLYLCDVDYIKANLDKYKIFSISKEWYQDYIAMGVRPENYVFMPNATAVVPKDVSQDINISYLGTRIWTDLTLPEQMKDYYHLAAAKNIVLENLNTGNADSKYYLDKFFAEQKNLYHWSEKKIYPLLEKRWLTLASVLDMGLTICGSYSRWEDVYETMPQLLAMYNPRRVWTLKEIIDFYNESKISLSPIHPQANGKAFPWRAFDVMGSNSCLVIERSSDFASLIDGKVDIPMFDSPYEVRDICKKLLSDEPLRKEIILQSQEWVDKNARWIDRFRTAEQVLGIKLTGGTNEGKIEDLVDIHGIIKTEKKSVSVCMVNDVVLVKGQKKGDFIRNKLNELFAGLSNITNSVKTLKCSLVTTFLTGVIAMFIDYKNIKPAAWVRPSLAGVAIISTSISLIILIMYFKKLLNKAVSFLMRKRGD